MVLALVVSQGDIDSTIHFRYSPIRLNRAMQMLLGAAEHLAQSTGFKDVAPFGGITYRYNDDLTLAAEYTSDLMGRNPVTSK